MSESSNREQLLEQCEGAVAHPIKRKRSTTTDSTSYHQCHNKGRGLVFQCNNCNKRYCNPCIDSWHSKRKEVLFVEACPYCLQFCNCGACLQKKGPSKIQYLEKTNLFAYIISVLLPSFKKQVKEAETQDNKAMGLIFRAEAILRLYDSTTDGRQALQTSCSCSTSDASSNFFSKAASREDRTNYIYSPIATLVADTEKSDPHFRSHFSDGQPVNVQGLMTGVFDLSWESGVMERVITSSFKKVYGCKDVRVINCANWCEEKIVICDFFNGYSEGMLDCQGKPKILKLELHPSDMFQKHLPRHYAELIRCLPFKQYTHPMSEYLNDVSMCISYGPHGGAEWDSVSKLQYGMSDRVSILVDVTSSISCRLNKGKSPVSNNTLHGLEAGAEWDIFRKKDIPKLEDYLSKHEELKSSILLPQVVHPNFHQLNVYLMVEHKKKLKDEYGIEPWTFVQKLGDATFLPAGCYYQMRNLQSCIHVAVDFYMPESLSQSAQFFEGRRNVPPGDIQMKYKLKVKELTLNAIDQAVEGWEKIPWGLGEKTPSLGFLTRKVEAMRLRLERERHKLPPATRTMLDDGINTWFTSVADPAFANGS